MNLNKFIFIFSILTMVLANLKNSFIVDYFSYYKLPKIVGYSCNVEEDDVLLIKTFNKNNVAISLRKLNQEHQVNRLALSKYSQCGVFLDLDCFSLDSIVSMLIVASDHRLFGELHSWLILSSHYNVNDILKFIIDDAFSLSTNFVIAIHSNDDLIEIYKLYDVYNAWKERGTKINVTFMGTWSENNKLDIIFNQSKFYRRRNMYGLTFRAYFHYSERRPMSIPWADYLQTYTFTPKDGLSKYGWIMLYHLSELMNFTFQSEVAPLWKKGDVVGPIQRAVFSNDTDVTGSVAVMSLKRINFVKFLHLSWPASPQKQDIKMKEILGPFDVGVWKLVAFFSFLCMWIMSVLFKHEHLNGILIEFSNSFILIIGALCQQGTDMQMSKISTRIAFLCIMVFSLLIYNYYSAIIVSSRLNDQIFKINDSLNELAKSGLKVSSDWMQYFDFIMKRPDWEIQMFYTKRWKYVPAAEQFMAPEKAMKMVQEGGFAYHTHPDIAYPFISTFYNNRETCELTEIHLLRPVMCGFAVSYNSSYIEFARVGLTKMAEVGIQQRQIKRWESPKPQCFSNILSAESLNINEFAPHLFILAFGMAVAITIFIFEKTKIFFREMHVPLS